MRLALSAIESGKEKRLSDGVQDITGISLVAVAPGSVGTAVRALRMAKKIDKYRQTARMLLEPWVVEKALARLGDRRLSLHEQQTVLEATRTPKKVAWPEWWEALS